MEARQQDRFRQEPGLSSRAGRRGYAGGKVVKIDRVEWNIIPDANTAVSALRKGEIDIVESIPLDFAKAALRPERNRRGVQQDRPAGLSALQQHPAAVQ